MLVSYTTVSVQSIVASEKSHVFHWFDYSNMLLSLILDLRLRIGTNEEGKSNLTGLALLIC